MLGITKKSVNNIKQCWICLFGITEENVSNTKQENKSWIVITRKE